MTKPECEYYLQCPSASGWCIATGPDERCMPFVQSAINTIRADRDAYAARAEKAEAECKRLEAENQRIMRGLEQMRAALKAWI